MAASLSAQEIDLEELKAILGVSEDDCRVLVEEFGNEYSNCQDVVERICEELETRQLTATELAWHVRQNPCFKFQKSRSLKDKPCKKDDLSWSTARSKSSNSSPRTSPQSIQQQRPISVAGHPFESTNPVPFSGTSKPVQIVRTPQGMDTTTVRKFLSIYMQDTELRKIFYDVHEMRNTKLMLLMRGASGSGKSTLASTIWSVTDRGEIFSADHYFINRKGEYKFNRAGLSDAHESCKNKCRAALVRGDTPIIIDNTNTRVDEMMPYVQLGVVHNYDIRMVEPKTEWKRKAGLLAIKTIHGVPKNTIEAQLERFENTSVNKMIAKALRLQQMDANSYRPNQDLVWTGVGYSPPNSPPPHFPGAWVSQPTKQSVILEAFQQKQLDSLNKGKPGLPTLKHGWTEPGPTSPRHLSDWVPNLNNPNANGAKAKKGKKGKSSLPPSPEIEDIKPAPIILEDPAHIAFNNLRRFFPTVPKEELEEIFNANEGSVDACAIYLMETGIEMADTNDEKLDTLPRLIPQQEEFPSIHTQPNSPPTALPELPVADFEAMEQRGSDDYSAELERLLQEHNMFADDDLSDAGTGMTDEEDSIAMTLPIEFARALLKSFGHPEDENRPLKVNELSISVDPDVAFELYKKLYTNMHATETGSHNNGSGYCGSGSDSTRSNSPIRNSEEDFNAIAISLSQMDLETKSGDPQLSTIMDIESKLKHQTQESLRGVSSPNRNMAQNLSFSMLKQEYSLLDATVVDEVFSQCGLKLDRARAALNEMYPQMKFVQQARVAESNEDDNWTVKYNPEDVKQYSAEVLREMQGRYEDLEAQWQSMFDKINDYNVKSKGKCTPHIRAHYVSEATKMAHDMKGIEDEIQYYRAIIINARHKNENVLDLHGLRVNGALRVMKEFLEYKLAEFRSAGTPKSILKIITGHGKHSKRGLPVLQPTVGNYLFQKGYKFHLSNPGLFSVHLTKGSIAAMMNSDRRNNRRY